MRSESSCRASFRVRSPRDLFSSRRCRQRFAGEASLVALRAAHRGLFRQKGHPESHRASNTDPIPKRVRNRWRAVDLRIPKCAQDRRESCINCLLGQLINGEALRDCRGGLGLSLAQSAHRRLPNLSLPFAVRPSSTSRRKGRCYLRNAAGFLFWDAGTGEMRLNSGPGRRRAAGLRDRSSQSSGKASFVPGGRTNLI